MNIIDKAAEIINSAIKIKASDIHLEPFQDYLLIRYRKDGILRIISKIAKEEAQNLIIRFKVLAGMDIATTRVSQDGKLNYFFEKRAIDLRFSTIPTIYGEKIVIRILDAHTGLISIENLRIPSVIKKDLLHRLHKQKGLFLVVGPTGSGKTTTLYALLRQMHSVENNTITIEDPVEYRIEGINQIQVNAKAGVTFASGLRAILRQDPDIILLGEVRDLETAEIALRAALTGHTVLGTLHTKDSVEAIIRLQDMGIPSFRIASALNAVLAQRLVQTYCLECQGAGCQKCDMSGYHGRQAVFEYLPITRKIQETINNCVGYNQLLDCVKKEGYVSFAQSGEELVLNKVSSLEKLEMISEL